MQTPLVSSMTNVSDLTGSAGLESLRHAAEHKDPAAAKATASKFESLFAEQLMKSMRATSMGDAMFPGSSSNYRELYDREISKKLTQGKGLGLQPMIRRALGDKTTSTAPSAPLLSTAISAKQSWLSLAKYSRAMPPQRQVVVPLSTTQTTARAATPTTTTTSAPSPVTKPAAQTLPGSVSTSQALSSHGSGRLSSTTSGASLSPPTSHGAPNRTFSTAQNFVAQIWPHAQRAAAELGVTPQVLIAQAALESGWGKHTGGDNNLFGIKAGSSWSGATRTVGTTEVSNGTAHRETASFRSYASVGESFDDYVKLIKTSPRYANALGAGTDPARFAHALQQAGYATDPAYAQKISSIANGPLLADAGLQKVANAPLIASR